MISLYAGKITSRLKVNPFSLIKKEDRVENNKLFLKLL
jgi:hypothetical protein